MAPWLLRSILRILNAWIMLAFMVCSPTAMTTARAFSEHSLQDDLGLESDQLSGALGRDINLAASAQSDQPSASSISESPQSPPASPTAKDSLRGLNREVVRLYQQGKYGEALGHALSTCETARHDLDEDDPELEACLSNLALIYKARGQYGQAESLLKESLEMSRKTRGENNPDFVTGLNNLANLYADTGRYSEAEHLYLQSLEIIRANAGEASSFMVKGLNNLASLYKRMGNLVAVEPLYAKARDLLAAMPGDNQADLAVVLSNLAHHICLLGRYSEAESLYRQSLEISRKTLGEPHPQVARTLNNLGSLHEAMGRYAEAEPLYQEALAVLTASSGKESPDVAAVMNNLAGLFKTMGDHAKAEIFYRQATDIWRAVLGQDHPQFASGLSNLADLDYQIGDFAAAEQLYERALAIERSSLGEVHPDVALTLQNLAVLYKTTGRYQEAEPLYRQALEIWKTSLGDRHPNVALALHNLAALYHGMGRYAEAEPLYRQAIELRTATLGEDHPDVAGTANNLAALCAATSRENEALELMNRAQSINDHLIQNVAAIASESQRLQYLSRIRGEMDGFLSLISQSTPPSPTAVADGLDLVLRRKAIVAEAAAAERDAVLGGRYPDLVPRLRELTTLRLQIARKMMSGPGPEGPEAHRQLLDGWQAEKETLEVTLASRIPEIGLERRLREADRHAIVRALPRGANLVEFVRFDVFDFRAIAALGQPLWKPARYLAFVLAAGEPERVGMVDLGPAEPIDRMISDFRSEITGRPEAPAARGIAAKTEPMAASDIANRLRAAVLDPLIPGLQGQKQLFLAPDGDLYRLPFEALPLQPGRCLIDEVRISYVGVGRDLLRFGSVESTRTGLPLIVADPDYDLATDPQGVSKAPVQTSTPLRRELFQAVRQFDRLPGTRAEAERVAAMLGVKPVMGSPASKGRLAEAHSPRILHIATHGFFLPDPEHRSGQNGWEQDWPANRRNRATNPLVRSTENPLLRSGLALAGVNAWLQGRASPVDAGDGILTGEEASGLDLLSTELVVLSACETGLGDIRVGEGVFGLRRAFLLAGAKTLVMSLWMVPDTQTQMLMDRLYQRLLAGEPRADALREAQLAVKAEFPEPFYWAGFICQGDPAPLPARPQNP